MSVADQPPAVQYSALSTPEPCCTESETTSGLEKLVYMKAESSGLATQVAVFLRESVGEAERR